MLRGIYIYIFQWRAVGAEKRASDLLALHPLLPVHWGLVGGCVGVCVSFLLTELFLMCLLIKMTQ